MQKLFMSPWPWYVAGPLIGLVVPALLIMGNKPFGISSTLRQICAACVPAGIPFFQYDWKKDIWNLFFVAGITIGGFIAIFVLGHPDTISIDSDTVAALKAIGITDLKGLMPIEIFSWDGLFTSNGLICIALGGFMVGFGTRYGNGCTSGHAITGLSNLQWPSLVATICFMAGGFFTTHVIIPWVIKI